MLCNKHNRIFFILLTVVAIGLVCVSSAVGDVLNVPSATYPTIQAGIDAAVYGDTVLVAAGTYYECIILEDGVAVIGAGESNTIIDGGAAGPGVRSTDCGPDTVLEGFTITNGSAVTYGGGMYNNSSSPTVTNCTFSGNTADSGGGMYNENSSPTVTNCTFSGNTADSGGDYDSGGGMYNYYSSPTVTNCTFSENSAIHWGGGMSNYESSPTLTNCTFSGNTADSGGGMSNYNYYSGSPTVTNCTFSGNTATISGGGMHNYLSNDSTVTSCTFSGNSAGDSGGGMFNYQSSPTVTDCTFSGNSADFRGGGGIYNLGSSPTVTNCTFHGNSVTGRGGGMGNRSSNPTVTNCTFSYNTASYDGGGMHNSTYSSPTVTNCTFNGNSAVNFGGGMHNYSVCNPIITNCIMWGNTAPTGPQIYNEAGSSPTITYSDVQGGYTGTGNIDADPLFTDADGVDDVVGTEDDNLRLRYNSPCIDAGDNSAVLSGVTTDLDGKERFVDGPFTPDTGNGTPPIVDMGAYEYDAGIVFVDADASTGGDGSTWADAYNYLQDALEEANSIAKPVEVWVAEGVYTPDPTGLADPCEATFQLASGVAIYGGFPSGGGIWEDRAPNAYETILSGDIGTPGDNSDNSYHVVTGSGTEPNAVLDGFTITAGNANKYIMAWDAGWHGGGMYNEYGNPTVANCTFSGNWALNGGGMCNYHGSPTVVDCTFSGNSASHGGGMYNVTDSTPTVTNCIFSGNSAGDSGGGMDNYTYSSPILTNCTFIANLADSSGGGLCNYNYSSPTLTNCTFTGNVAIGTRSDNGMGGGMFNRYFSDPTMTNCIFSGNLANYAGGAMFTWDSCIPTLSNCTFSQNSALNGKALACHDPQGWCPPSTLEVTNCILWDGGGEIWNDDGSTITINYSDVNGGYTGTGNIDDDPLFLNANGPDGTAGTEDDNLRLSSGSNCIDTGNNSAVPVGVTTDLDGHPRIVDGDGNITALVDMGAYELNWTYIGDFDNNWTVDLSDFAVFGRAFSSEPGDALWNPDCDISVPADNSIDWRDLYVLSNNWLARARFSPIPRLLFSEYVEGFGYNQAVEIYNAGDVEVYLGGCEVRIYNNGSFFPNYIVSLNAFMLAPGEVFVLGHSGISVPSFCDQLSAGLAFSGNDAIELAYQGSPHDVIGQIGFDPGYPGWGSGGITTLDHTLRRKCSVSTGDWFGYDSFDPAVEWEAFAVNTFDGLGSHCQ